MLESDADDRQLTKEILQELQMPVQLTFFDNSEALTNAVQTTAPSLLLIADNSVPSNTLQLLEALKKSPQSAEIPAVVLSESDASSYVAACYIAGAATVVKKPLSMESTRRKIRLFFQYWLEVAII